jgi:hypothetical protein
MRIDNPNITGSLTYGDGSIVSASFSETASFYGGSVTSASFSETASFYGGSVTSASFSETASFYGGSVTSASHAESSSITSHIENYNTTSGSLSFWQGSQAEYNAISNSADPNTVYFVR